MDKRLLKKAALQSIALMLAVITFSFALRQYHMISISASNLSASEKVLAAPKPRLDLNQSGGIISAGLPDFNNYNKIAQAAETSGFTGMLQDVNSEIINQLGDRFLIIKKPAGNNLTFSLDDLYISKSIQITIGGLSSGEIDSSFIGRKNGDDVFQGDPDYTEYNSYQTDDDGNVKKVILKDYGNDLVHGITIANKQNDAAGDYTAQLTIELDNVYVHIIEEDASYYYIELKKPKEVYDKVLVIDAGHGGKDPGAISENGEYYEKDLNLKILLALKEMLDKEPIKVYYTRLGDDKVFLRPRVDLANSVDCDFFVSIHCNANEVTWPNGMEVYYYDNIFKNVSNKKLAELFSSEISKTISLKANGLFQKHNDEVFIMEKAVVPSVLVESGFITNNSDLNYLLKDENIKKEAQGIYNSIIQSYKEFYKKDIQ